MKVQNLILDGLELMSNDYYFVALGLFSFDKTIITNDQYSNGQNYNSSKVLPKNVVMNGSILTNDIHKILALNAILASNKLKTLVVVTQELGTLYCKVEVKNRAVGSSPNIISFQLLMPDPYLYLLEPEIITLGATSNSGLTFPFTFPIIFGASTGGQGIVTNIGNAVAYPVIAIVGTCDTFTITNQTTGESMSLAVSLSSDYDMLIIDSRESSRSILINGINRIDLKVGDWLSCVPGDNTFVFTRNSLQVKQHLTIQLQGRWL